MTPIDVTKAAEIPAMIDRFGFALWRQLYPKALTDALVASALANAADIKSYSSIGTGSMHLGVLDKNMRTDMVTPEIVSACGLMLGTNAIKLMNAESVLFIQTPDFEPTAWHQDASVNTYLSAGVWIALVDCGVDAPGLSLALQNQSEPIEVFYENDVHRREEKEAAITKTGWPILTPAFKAGDVLFSTSLSIHKTYRTPDMPRHRVALKLSFAAKTAQPQT